MKRLKTFLSEAPLTFSSFNKSSKRHNIETAIETNNVFDDKGNRLVLKDPIGLANSVRNISTEDEFNANFKRTGKKFDKVIELVDGSKISINTISKTVTDSKNSKKTSGPKSIQFSGGNNTPIGESIQIAGMILPDPKKATAFKFGKPGLYNDLKAFLTDSGNNLAAGNAFFDKYMAKEEDFNAYAESIVTTLGDAFQAMRELKSYMPKTANILHKDIKEFYKISKNRNWIDKNISKDSTADCLLYTGPNFLSNLGNKESELDASDYDIKVKINGKVTNTFVQISLKNGGRLGDISTFTKIADDIIRLSNMEKLTDLDEGFWGGAWDKVKGGIQKVTLNINNSIKKSISKLIKVLDIKKWDSEFSKISRDLIAKDAPKGFKFKFWEAGGKYATEDEIFEVYKDAKKWQGLKATIDSGLLDIRKTLRTKLGDGVVVNMPMYKLAQPTNKTKMRYLYYDAVSVLTMQNFLKKISTVEDFQKLEVDIMYGNTALPLVVVYTNDAIKLKKLPVLNQDNNKETREYPVVGFKYSISQAKQENTAHLSFYFFVLSVTNTDEPKYIQIQMRTKQEKQYVVDGQGIYTYNQFKSKMGIK